MTNLKSMLSQVILRQCKMNDEVVDVFEPVGEALPGVDRIVEAPRPQVPIRTIINFKIVDERDNSKG